MTGNFQLGGDILLSLLSHHDRPGDDVRHAVLIRELERRLEKVGYTYVKNSASQNNEKQPYQNQKNDKEFQRRSRTLSFVFLVSYKKSKQQKKASIDAQIVFYVPSDSAFHNV